MSFFDKFFQKKKKRKHEDLQKISAFYRCPQCGKDTEITTYFEYKQLYKCEHCGRTMVICHGRTIGYK